MEHHFSVNQTILEYLIIHLHTTYELPRGLRLTWSAGATCEPGSQALPWFAV